MPTLCAVSSARGKKGGTRTARESRLRGNHFQGKNLKKQKSMLASIAEEEEEDEDHGKNVLGGVRLDLKQSRHRTAARLEAKMQQRASSSPIDVLTDAKYVSDPGSLPRLCIEATPIRNSSWTLVWAIVKMPLEQVDRVGHQHGQQNEQRTCTTSTKGKQAGISLFPHNFSQIVYLDAVAQSSACIFSCRRERPPNLIDRNCYIQCGFRETHLP
ncbi:unnamed protein product [Amoebophrya sp. A25]|nr:unnamed protein product [Amoebophrya sp. A25]|eukprot:GSA25T00018897001.1